MTTFIVVPCGSNRRDRQNRSGLAHWNGFSRFWGMGLSLDVQDLALH